MRFRQKPPNFNSPNVNRQVSDLDGLRIESRLRVIAAGFDIRWYGGKRPTTQTRIIARIETVGPQREISSFTLVLFFYPPRFRNETRNRLFGKHRFTESS